MDESTLYLELGRTQGGTVTPMLAVTDPELIAEVGRLLAKRLGAVGPAVERVLGLFPSLEAK